MDPAGTNVAPQEGPEPEIRFAQLMTLTLGHGLPTMRTIGWRPSTPSSTQSALERDPGGICPAHRFPAVGTG
ncbi:MAG: hypothetical protein NVS3B21_07480 [Acidimicrobiales bacterium]